jgi:hypothetical protein
MSLPSSENWGPFSPAISHPERVARLRTLRAIAQLHCGLMSPLVKALWLAESGEQAEIEAAVIELDRLPAKARRHVLCSYGAHCAYKPKDAKSRTTGQAPNDHQQPLLEGAG